MLRNTAYRLQKEKKLTIGFFGGSITEGTGATSWDETSWRGYITNDLKKTYPDSEIIPICAAVGGTGTDLGLCRVGHDLLQYHPNLVFIEFAVNDFDFTWEAQLAGYESCLRQILTYDPTTEIVCVFTATKATEKQLLEKGDYRSRTAQTILAHHYGLDMVDLGEHLRDAVAKAGGDWLRYTTDTTHPNDAGYLVYAEAMKSALIRLLADIPDKIIEKELPTPYVDAEKIPYGELIEARAFANEAKGFRFVGQKFKRRFPYYWMADGIGSEMTVSFEGTAFGIYWIMDQDSGMVEVTLDGKESVLVSAYDDYCKAFSRGGYTFPFKNLERGKYSVTIRVSEQKDAESEGNKIAIYGFLIVK